ncbi:hypothetical protein BJY52DRAFT_1197090 [Lactarius psammicola]|nr:hypothetical protein BJY52DRAFT_1197090 [Lactarius psammicola]
MASKKSQSSGLTKPEMLLFAIAVRLNTVIRYLAENPGGDNSWFISGITAEMKQIATIYVQYPQDGGVRHHVHGSIGVVAKEWKIAEEENCSPNVGKLSVKVVDKCCANTVKNFPQWPSVLHLTDLSEYVKEQPQENLWWELPGSPMDMSAEDSGDGLHRLGRINKGKAPAPLDVEPVPAPQQHGKKCSVVESTGDSNKTACCAVAPPSRRVVVKSPPEARRLKQCLCIGEDGQAAEPVLSEEQDSGAPEGVWVSRGETGWGSVKLQVKLLWRCRAQPHAAIMRRRNSPAMANQDMHMATLEESIQELTESHKKLMGTQKQILSMMLAVCSYLGIKVIMPDDSTTFAVVHSTALSIPSPLVDDVSSLHIGRPSASAAASVASTLSTHSSMRSGTSAFHTHPVTTDEESGSYSNREYSPLAHPLDDHIPSSPLRYSLSLLGLNLAPLPEVAQVVEQVAIPQVQAAVSAPLSPLTVLQSPSPCSPSPELVYPLSPVFWSPLVAPSSLPVPSVHLVSPPPCSQSLPPAPSPFLLVPLRLATPDSPINYNRVAEGEERVDTPCPVSPEPAEDQENIPPPVPVICPPSCVGAVGQHPYQFVAVHTIRGEEWRPISEFYRDSIYNFHTV